MSQNESEVMQQFLYQIASKTCTKLQIITKFTRNLKRFLHCLFQGLMSFFDSYLPEFGSGCRLINNRLIDLDWLSIFTLSSEIQKDWFKSFKVWLFLFSLFSHFRYKIHFQSAHMLVRTCRKTFIKVDLNCQLFTPHHRLLKDLNLNLTWQQLFNWDFSLSFKLIFSNFWHLSINFFLSFNFFDINFLIAKRMLIDWLNATLFFNWNNHYQIANMSL